MGHTISGRLFSYMIYNSIADDNAEQRLYKTSMNITIIMVLRAQRLKWEMRNRGCNSLKRNFSMNEIDFLNEDKVFSEYMNCLPFEH